MRLLLRWSLTPSQAVEGTAKFSNWGRWRDGTGLALPCLKNLAASAQPRNLRPRLQQGESSTVEREREEKGKRKGRRGEIQHDCLQPLLLQLSTNLHPRRAMVSNNHGTPKT